jgi:hypothetical protein
MEANKKRKIIIWSSVLTILGIGGYFGYKWLKDNGKIGKPKPKPNTDTPNLGNQSSGGSSSGGSSSGGSSSGGSSSGGSSSKITAEEKALATQYRVWANSTDELSKKWGKKSTYDLDASSTTPYNSFFLKSYNGGGKAEYEKYIASAQTGSSDNQIAAINNLSAIASKYNQPLLSHATFGNFITMFFAAEKAGKIASFKLQVSTKDSKGKSQPDGKLVFITQEGTFTHYKPAILGYQTLENKDLVHTKKWTEETYSTILNSGHVIFKDEKFVGKTLWGIGKGTQLDNKYLSSFALQASGNQIYGIFDYGTYTS